MRKKRRQGNQTTGTMPEGKFKAKEELEMDSYKILQKHDFYEILNYGDSFFG